MTDIDPQLPQGSADAVILIVDDVTANRLVLASLLRKAGYQVLAATSAQQALLQINMQVPDLIMLDIMMPGVDGYTLCRRLQEEPATRRVPVIFLSALSDPLDKVEAFASGGADYVAKPYQAAEVLARVAHQLRIARLQRELEREKAELLRMNEKLLAAQRQTEQVFNFLSEALPGTTLDGKYVLEDKLGAGGFGVVYRAMHRGLQKQVAIKIFRPVVQNEREDALRRFQVEGISACRVNHPNAVAILDSGTSAQGIFYLVMELLSGPTLHARMWERRRMPLQLGIQIMVPVLDVLVAAHAAGVLHRDIKPENIMLHKSPQGEVVKVLDFGLAKLLGDEHQSVTPAVTAANKFVGTPIYMAPERMDKDEYDGRSDVFSTAVLLYEMLTGQLPFADRDQPLLRVVFNHLHAAPVPLRTYAPELPAKLEDLLRRALSKDKLQRPTAQQFRDELLALNDASRVPTLTAAPPVSIAPIADTTSGPFALPEADTRYEPKPR
jgi:serine/threonine protein kinase/CheY-like chemotaxis protein